MVLTVGPFTLNVAFTSNAFSDELIFAALHQIQTVVCTCFAHFNDSNVASTDDEDAAYVHCCVRHAGAVLADPSDHC